MRRRLLTFALALSMAIGAALVLASPSSAAYYPPRDGCMSIIEDTPTTIPYYMTWQGGYHRAGTWRVAMNCGSVNYRSLGHGFEAKTCTEVRLVNLGTDWVTDNTGPWMTACDGQSAIKLANVGVGGVDVNDRVYFDCRDANPANRRSNWICLFRFTL